MLETVLLATLTPIVWATGFLVTARLFYQRARPSKVPVCSKKHEHHKTPRDFGQTPGCYRQYSDFDTEGDAVFGAVVFGLIWPLLALFLGARAVIVSGAPEFPEEKTARLKSMDERIAALEEERME